MLRYQLRAARLGICVLAFLAIACGDDDPAAVDDPCDDANVSCFTINVGTDDLTYTESHSSGTSETVHTLDWSTAPVVLRGFGPGKRIVLMVQFDPPIEVMYDHSYQRLEITAGANTTFDQTATATATGQAHGWTVSDRQVALMRETGTGAPRMSTTTRFEPMKQGETLTQVNLEFTVPETYDGGEPVLPGDLPIIYLNIAGISFGNNLGNPAVWPVGHPF